MKTSVEINFRICLIFRFIVLFFSIWNVFEQSELSKDISSRKDLQGGDLLQRSPLSKNS